MAEEHRNLSRFLPDEIIWILEAIRLREKARRQHSIRLTTTSDRVGGKAHHQYSVLSRYEAQRVLIKKAYIFARRNALRLLKAYSLARDEVLLLRNGVLSELPFMHQPSEGMPGRVMYLANNSLPFDSAGYATRTHGLVSSLRKLGLNNLVVTRLGYPAAIPNMPRNEALNVVEYVDNVPYLRLVGHGDSQIVSASSRAYINANIAAAAREAGRFRPSIIHGASNYITGLTAVGLARALNIPSVYEVRGLWEITALSRDPSYADTLHFAHDVRLETEACLGADRVITITDALKNELIRRGVPAEKIDVVPNGVDTERFRPQPRDTELALRLGIFSDHVVIGYVGSVVDYEGLDDLLRAVHACIAQGATNLRLLIVGDGAAYQSCRALAGELGLGECAIFTGRVPHHEADAYYSLIDIAPFSRKPSPVTEMVSPLKPFEAMAMGKCVVVSSVAALAEIIGKRPIGFVYEKGSIEALTETIMRLGADRELRHKVGEEARRFVIAERDWQVLAQRVALIYDNLLKVRESRGSGPSPTDHELGNA
jgi:glycosyltransferase involved in cell wall biosynthesis